MSVAAWIERMDRDLFLWINHDSGRPALDSFMMLLRNPLTWIPLYIFIAVYAYRKLTRKAFIVFLISTLITVILTDSLCARIIKPLVGRLRPCCEPALDGMVRALSGCGGKYSFPSNHAANHTGMATIWFFSFAFLTGKKFYWLWTWAFAVGYAQIYVGKHYPVDVLAGTGIGMLVGYVLYSISKKNFYIKENFIRSTDNKFSSTHEGK